MNRSPPSPIAPDVLEAELEYLIKDGSCYTSSPIFSDDESVTFTQIDDLKISRSPQAVSPITRERPATDHFIQLVSLLRVYLCMKKLMRLLKNGQGPGS